MGRLHLSETRLLIGPPPPGPDPSILPRGVPAILNTLPEITSGYTWLDLYLKSIQ